MTPSKVAILRRCRRCADWQSIDAYKPLARICERCMQGGEANHRIGLIRGLVLTEKGKAAIAAELASA